MHVVGRGRRAGGVPVLRVPVLRVPVLVRLAVAEVVAVVGAGVLVLVGVRMPVAVAVAVAVRGGDGRDGRGAVLQELRVEVERAFQLEGLGGARWGEPVLGATQLPSCSCCAAAASGGTTRALLAAWRASGAPCWEGLGGAFPPAFKA